MQVCQHRGNRDLVHNMHTKLQVKSVRLLAILLIMASWHLVTSFFVI